MSARLLIIIAALVLQFALAPISASAHQPVSLTSADTTAAKGPLLTDGTISFAVRASFTRAGEKRGFRAAFKTGDLFTIQYLILDKKPENVVRTNLLPTVVITSPSGKKITIRISERTKFFEPYSKTNYLFLARDSFEAEPGIYNILMTSRGKAAITIAIGDKEIPGEVVRGALPTVLASAKPSATPTPTPTPTPTATATKYTMDLVRQNNSASSCWSAINGNVYDLTRWINSHPGGASAIRSLCGIDGTSAFKAQHANQSRPEQRLDGYLLGPLSKP
ncbi:MAG: cytochrome b5 domain-containing protein [Candidatus Nanopelagicaceae bacterium]